MTSKLIHTEQLTFLFFTLRDKIINFVSDVYPYSNNNYTTGSDEMRSEVEYIKKNFSSWQYNGSAPFLEVKLWCEEHFENDWIWNFETIYFKHEKDKSLFLLRWA